MWEYLPELEKFFQNSIVKIQKQETIQDFFTTLPLSGLQQLLRMRVKLDKLVECLCLSVCVCVYIE